MDGTLYFFLFLFLQHSSPFFHSAAVISGVRHPASTTTVTILEQLLPAVVPTPLVGVEESEEEEETAAVAERRLAFLAGLPARIEEVELIPKEGGTERWFELLALLLLRQATRAEAAAAEAREKTREVGRPAVSFFFFREEEG